jgi:hypothetical protein
LKGKIMTHLLKVWPTPFAEIRSGNKSSEFRIAKDRVFRFGDVLVLCEYNPSTKTFTGEQETRMVTHVTRGPDFGVPKGCVVMSIR